MSVMGGNQKVKVSRDMLDVANPLQNNNMFGRKGRRRESTDVTAMI